MCTSIKYSFRVAFVSILISSSGKANEFFLFIVIFRFSVADVLLVCSRICFYFSCSPFIRCPQSLRSSVIPLQINDTITTLIHVVIFCLML